MKDYKKNMLLALGCFLVIVVLNFFLPRLLPGDPVAYLTGFAEEDMTPAQIDYYRQALHLDKPLIVQFGYYLRSLADGTLGYSYKKAPPLRCSSANASAIRFRSPSPPSCFRRRWGFHGDLSAATGKTAWATVSPPARSSS